MGAVAIADAIAAQGRVAKLELGHNPIADTGATAVASALRSLGSVVVSLDLTAVAVRHAGSAAIIAALPFLPRLAAFYFSQNSLGVLDGSALTRALVSAATPELATLELALNPIGDAGAIALFGALRTLPKLTSLVVSGCAMGDLGLNALTAALRGGLPLLKSLSIAGNACSDAAAGHVFDALRNVPALESLDVSDIGLTAAGAAALSRAAPSLPALSFLDVSHNCLTDDGVCALAPALHFVPLLRSLILRGTSFGVAGAVALGSCLRSVPELTCLDVSDNTIGDAGAAALATGLRSVPQLTSLKLAKTGIGDEGAAALAAAMTFVPLISRFSLDGNDAVGAAGSFALTHAFRSLPQLTAVEADRGAIHDAAALRDLAEDTPGVSFTFGPDPK